MKTKAVGKYNSFGFAFRTIGVLIVFAIALTIGLVEYIPNFKFINTGKAINLNEELKAGKDIEDFNGKFVEAELTGAFFAYAQTVHKTSSGKVTREEDEFLVYINDDVVMSVSVKGDDRVEEMKLFCNEFYDTLAIKGEKPEPYRVRGEIREVTGEELKVFKKGVAAIGTEAAGNVKVYEFSINTTITRRGKAVVIAISFVVAAVAFMIAMSGFAKIIANDKKRGEENSVEAVKEEAKEEK